MLLRALGFAYPFLGFHVAERGHGAEAVGAIMTAFGVGWVVGQLICGWLTDRVGRRVTLASTMAVTAVALVVAANAQTVTALAAAAAMTGLFYDGVRPIVGTLICDLVPDHKRRAKIETWRYGWVANTGALVCGGIGAFSNLLGVAALFWMNAAACAAVAIVALLWVPDGRPVTASQPARSYGQTFRDRRFVYLLISSLATLTAFIGLSAALPLVMSVTGHDADQFAIVFMANAIAVIIVSPVLAPRLSRALSSRPRPDLLIVSGLWTTGSMALIGFGTGTAWFIAAAIGLGISESAWFVFAVDIVQRLAPPEVVGWYQGVWGSTMAIAAILSPALAAASLSYGGQHYVGYTLIAFGAIGALAALPLLPMAKIRHA